MPFDKVDPQVEAVFTASQIARTPVPTGDPVQWSLLQRERASYYPGRSGDFVVFLKRDAGRGLDEDGVRSRLAKAAKVHIGPPREAELPLLRELLAGYGRALLGSGQEDEARTVRALTADAMAAFLAVRPGGDIVVDQTVSTE